MKKTMKILIIDDEAPIRDVLSANLKDDGHDVHVAADGLLGLKALEEFQPEVTFLDIWMPGKIDGIDVLTQAKRLYPEVEFVMISGHGTIETAVKATKLGAWDFIEKPLSMDKINIVLNHIELMKTQRQEKSALLNRLRRNLAFVGDSAFMKNLKEEISKHAARDYPVLIQGPVGSGKQLSAQNLHCMGDRLSYGMVEMNCASSPQDLIEGELFGIEAMSLPGVEKPKIGKLDLAEQGTLLIKEVHMLKIETQRALAQYIRSKSFTRQGGKYQISKDVRLILTTSEDWQSSVRSGRIAQELYDSVGNNVIKTIGLKDHLEDLPSLISHFSDQFCAETGEPKKVISERAMERMQTYTWPGNTRELRNFMERVYILTPGEYIDVHDLSFAGLSDSSEMLVNSGMKSFRDARAHFEKDYLVKKIQENGGNISKTAEMIGLERSYLHRKIKLYNIEVST
ncbi:MAG: sigma-54-dependent transcriptional regulator [Pseudobdellovibrionaceae bacterium]|jgi:two-component system nitrogen regulation response regulator NtrX